MPKPTPDDLPGEIRDLIAAHGYTGAGELGEHLGLSHQRLLTVCRSKKAGLKIYIRLAGRLNLSLDQLVSRIEAGELPGLIEKLAQRERKSLRQLSTELGASPSFLSEKLKKPEAGALKTYIEVAQALNWSLQYFSEVLLRHWNWSSEGGNNA